MILITMKSVRKIPFSDPISHSNYAITSAKGTSYDSLDDLSGKKTEVISGSNYAQVLENGTRIIQIKNRLKSSMLQAQLV